MFDIETIDNIMFKYINEFLNECEYESETYDKVYSILIQFRQKVYNDLKVNSMLLEEEE